MSDLHASIPVVEALIFSAGSPVGLAQLKRVLPDLSSTQLRSIVGQINGALEQENRPYEIAEVAGGYQFRTRPEFAAQIRGMQPERKLRLSRAALETLSVIAYRQPTTRAEIEDLRCVDCGAVVKGLLERGLVRIMGRRDAPGRPVLYGTSASFLERFGLPSLRDLPELRELEGLEEERGTAQHEDDGADPAPSPTATSVDESDGDGLAPAEPPESMEPEPREPPEPEGAPPR